MDIEIDKIRIDDLVEKAGGTRGKLAEVLDMTPQAVYQWKGEFVPLRAALLATRVRPDWFKPQADAADPQPAAA